MSAVEFRYNIEREDSESSHILRRYTMLNNLTQTHLHTLFNYDKDTGIFTHKFTKGRLGKKDSIAGCVSSKGYTVIKVNSKPYKAHRLAWLYVYGCMPEKQIDHINGVKDDNRIDNLRTVTDAQNSKNLPMCKNNISGIVGVYFCKTMKRWTSHIGVNGKTKTLGRFKTMEDAISVRKEAERKYGFHTNHGRST